MQPSTDAPPEASQLQQAEAFLRELFGPSYNIDDLRVTLGTGAEIIALHATLSAEFPDTFPPAGALL